MRNEHLVVLLALLAAGGSGAGHAAGFVPRYSYVDLGVIGAAYSINDSGQMAGVYDVTGVGSLAARWDWAGSPATLLPVPSGSTYSEARDINAVGSAVGAYVTASGLHWAMTWDAGGVALELAGIGGLQSHAYGINDAGQVVGWASPASGGPHAVRWNPDGTVTDLTPGGSGSARTVNANGQAAGYILTAEGPDAARWDADGTMTDLGTLGGWGSYAYAINARGEVIGQSSVSGSMTPHAVLWDQQGAAVDLNPQNAAGSWAYGLNDYGWGVGTVRPAAGMDYASLWLNGAVYNLNQLVTDPTHLPFRLWEAEAINNRGQIVALALEGPGRTHAVLLTLENANELPVPEPGTVALLLCGGLCGAGLVRRVRSKPTAT